MILSLINIVYNILTVIIIGSVLLSWLPNLRWTPIGRLIEQCSEPLLLPFRSMIRPIPFGSVTLDISPFLCLLALQIIYRLLLRVLGSA